MIPIRQAIDYAVKWEKYARDTYIFWAKHTSDKDCRRLFENLARMEETHVRILSGIKLDEDVDIKVPFPDYTDLLKGVSMHPTSKDKDIKSILEYAMRKEEKAHIRYEKVAKRLKEGMLKKLFSQLAAEETHHRRLIRNEHNRIFSSY